MESLIKAETTITRSKGLYNVELELNAPPRYRDVAKILLEKINPKNPRSLDGANMVLNFKLKEQEK